MCPPGLGCPVTESELSDSKPQKPHHSVLGRLQKQFKMIHPLSSYLGLSSWGTDRAWSLRVKNKITSKWGIINLPLSKWVHHHKFPRDQLSSCDRNATQCLSAGDSVGIKSAPSAWKTQSVPLILHAWTSPGSQRRKRNILQICKWDSGNPASSPPHLSSPSYNLNALRNQTLPFQSLLTVYQRTILIIPKFSLPSPTVLAKCNYSLKGIFMYIS